MLDLSDIQASSLNLVFHFADNKGWPLLDLKDLRAVIQFLISEEGSSELRNLGGLARPTAGVLLRELIAFSDAGAEDFFGEPEFKTADLLRTTADGKGVVSILGARGGDERVAVDADLRHDGGPGIGLRNARGSA